MPLDLWQRNQDTALNSPSGAYLPTWWELHGPETLWVIGAAVGFVVLFYLILRPHFLLDLIINCLAILIRTGRAVRAATTKLWAAAVDRS